MKLGPIPKLESLCGNFITLFAHIERNITCKITFSTFDWFPVVLKSYGIFRKVIYCHGVIDGFQCSLFPAHALVTLTSVVNLGGKKMQRSRQE